MAHEHVPALPAASAALLAVYLSARYQVRCPHGPLWLQVGQPAPPALDAFLPAATWTLVTAWNPGSKPWPEARNRCADIALQAALDALGRRRLPALASDVAGHWPEPGWLVADLAAAQADVLARRFGQAGALYWQASSPVRLRMYLPAPVAGPIRSPWVDWVPPAADAIRPG